MSRYSVIRLLETFFRRWWLYLVPLVLLCALGGLTAATKENVYKSEATVEVSSTLLDEQFGTTTNFGYDTPAAATVKQINSKLQTQLFVDDVATRARLTDLVKGGFITYDKIRSSIGAAEAGSTLFRIVVLFEDPAVAQLLAQATIDSYIDSVVDDNTQDFEVAVAFLDAQLTTYDGELAAARDELSAYLLAHPSPGFGATRPDDETVEINRLQATVDQAEERYNQVVSKMEDARVKTEQTKASVGRRIRTVDAPQIPTVPEGGLKSTIVGFTVFLAMGIMISVAAVVIATTLDHSIRFPSDLRDRLGLNVVAVVPDSKAVRSIRPARRGRNAPEVAEPTRERLAPRVSSQRTIAPSAPPAPTRERPAERPAASHRPPDSRPTPPPPAPRREAPAGQGVPRPPRPPAERPVERPAAERPLERPVPAAERPAVAGGPVRREADTMPSVGSASADREETGRAWPPGRRRGGEPGPNGSENGSGWPPKRGGSGQSGNIPHAS